MMEPDKVTNDILDLLVWEDENENELPGLIELATRARKRDDPNWTEAINYCTKQHEDAQRELDARAEYWRGVATMYEGARHYVRSEWRLAINHFSHSEKIFEQKGRLHAQGIAQLALALAHRRQGDRGQAFLWFRECRDIFEQLRAQNKNTNRKKGKLYQDVIDRSLDWFDFRTLPVIAEDKIPLGEERPASDQITGYVRQTDEFEFEFEGQALRVELLKGHWLTFSREYDYFAMPVSGDSMDRAGIASNDYVIVQRKAKPDSSRDIAAVVFRDEDNNKATLKRIYVESDRVILKPDSSNPQYQPRELEPEAFSGDNPLVRVVGVAIAVLKK